ncbi:MAG TPA: hypothetical protein VEU51_17030, partial [Candidatus Acidoferrales bacterium]|nr:hypothetical protein [Candidatus Acidoferrales bacterium]
ENPDDRMALSAYTINVKGNVFLYSGKFEGVVMLGGSTIGSDLQCGSGKFINPGGTAIFAPGATIGGVVYLTKERGQSDFEVNGLVNFSVDRIDNSVVIDGARFLGARSEPHGLNLAGISVKRAFTWRDVTMQNGATLDLSGASVAWLVDEEKSWPAPGDLKLDGFQYSGFGLESPNDVQSRLRWLGLQPAGFHVQPYRQLAKIYSDNGDEVSALRILVAKDDARYVQYGVPGRLWGGFLKYTIGYGHRPFLAMVWSLAVVLFGWAMTAAGKRAGVMRPTWPENVPSSEPAKPYERLHPLLYSLDVFLPFVNLHQEHYWWTDSAAKGEVVILNQRVPFSGAVLRSYFWMQIIAGWLLSAIFVAGITGLLRND